MKLTTESSFSPQDKTTDLKKPVKFSYKFLFKAFDANTGWLRDLSGFINEIQMYNEIDDSYFPITKIDFAFDKYTIANLYQRRKTVRYLLQIQISESDDTEELTSQSGELYSDILSQVELITMDFPQLDYVEEFYEEFINDEKNTNNLSDVPDQYLSLEFFKLSHVKSSNTLINRCYTGREAGIAALGILSLQADQSVMMQVPHNGKQYNHILIPPNNMNQSINHIQQKYQIYQNDITLYHDFWTTWLMDYEERDCPPPGNYIYSDYQDMTIEVVSETTAVPETEGVIRDDILKIRTINNPMVINVGDGNKQVSGQNFFMTTFNNEERVTIERFNSGQDSLIEKEVYLQNASAENMISGIKSRINTSDVQVEVYLSRCDFRIFTPERKVNIVVDSSNNTLDIPAGKYLIDKSVYAFKRVDFNASIFTLNTTLMLTRQKI